MRDARQVNAHYLLDVARAKAREAGRALLRGIDINAALQRRQSSILGVHDIDFRLIDALSVSEQRNRFLLGTIPNSHDGQSPRSTRKCYWQEHGHYRSVIIVGNSKTCAGEVIDADRLDTIRAVAPEYGQVRSAGLGVCTYWVRSGPDGCFLPSRNHGPSWWLDIVSEKIASGLQLSFYILGSA